MKPDMNNVYGYLRPENCLKDAQKVFLERIGISEEQACFKIDSTGNHLVIVTEKYEFQSGKTLERGVSFQGSVSGSREEVLATIDAIAKKLSYVGISSEFEIYDESHNCIATTEQSA